MMLEMGAAEPAVLPWDPLAAQVPVVMVAVNALRRGDSPRLNGESGEHVRVLAGAQGPLPPILVHRPTMQVIDGMHRLYAAVMRGEDTIAARLVDCEDKDIFVIAVQANTAHGLPLSLTERKTAAARIIEVYPHWSDRLIALAAGLSHKTVAALRGPATGENPQLLARTGRDGRARPLSSAAGRRAAAAVLKDNPGASLQQVADMAGVSPGTVRDVRDRIACGQDPARPGHYPSRAAPANDAGRAAILQRLMCDPALRFSDSGRAILRQLHASTVGIGELGQALATVPPHSAIVIGKLARANARKWMELARQLEERASST